MTSELILIFTICGSFAIISIMKLIQELVEYFSNRKARINDLELKLAKQRVKIKVLTIKNEVLSKEVEYYYNLSKKE